MTDASRDPGPAITLYCLECGYNLRSLCTRKTPTGQCPECGADYDFYVNVQESNTGRVTWGEVVTDLAAWCFLYYLGIMLLLVAYSFVMRPVRSFPASKVISWALFSLCSAVLLFVMVRVARSFARDISRSAMFRDEPSFVSAVPTGLMTLLLVVAQMLVVSLMCGGCATAVGYVVLLHDD